MEIECFQQLFLDARAYSVTEECAVGHDDCGARRTASPRGIPMQLAHNKLEEQQCGLGSLSIVRKIPLNPFLFLAAKWRVCEDHINPVLLPDFRELEAQSVAGINVRSVEAMQQQVHLAKQIRQRLRLTAEKRFFL